MSVTRKVTKVGGSLGVLIPRDFAAAMNVTNGSEVRVTLIGRQVVIEPLDDTMDDVTFRRAFATVLRQQSEAFEGLAAYDQGRPSPAVGRDQSRRTAGKAKKVG